MRQGEISVAEITIDNVRKSFGALEVLHGVSAKAAAKLTWASLRSPAIAKLLPSRL